MAWSIGKSLYDREPRQLVLRGRKGGKILRTVLLPNLCPSIVRLGAWSTSAHFEYVRPTNTGLESFHPQTPRENAHEISSTKGLRQTRFPARTDQLPLAGRFHLLPRGTLRSPSDPQELAVDFPCQDVRRYPGEKGTPLRWFHELRIPVHKREMEDLGERFVRDRFIRRTGGLVRPVRVEDGSGFGKERLDNIFVGLFLV